MIRRLTIPYPASYCSVAMMASLLTAALMLAPAHQAGSSPLLFENGPTTQFSWAGDTLTLRHGSGWIRTKAVLTDFVFMASFRLHDTSSRAEIGIRSLVAKDFWPKRSCTILLDATDDPGVMHGRGVDPAVRTAHAQAPPSAGEWHTLEIKGEMEKVTIVVDGQVDTVTEIPFYSGPIILHPLSGSVDFREISIRSLPSALAANADADASNPDPRIKEPELTKKVPPNYTQDAMQRKVQGHVELGAIVLADGSVGPVWLTTFLDPDLDQSAVAAVSQWRFKPATRDGQPIPMRISIDLEFKLH